MADSKYLPCSVVGVASPVKAEAAIVVLHSIDKAANVLPSALFNAIEGYAKVDSGLAKGGIGLVPVSEGPLKAIIVSHTGGLQDDFSDSRDVTAAAESGIKRALSAGYKNLALVTLPHAKFPKTELLGALGALQALYVPWDIRVARPEKKQKADLLEIVTQDKALVDTACGLEVGRCVARDVSGGDPEVTAPPAVAEYIKEAFGSGGAVSVKVTEDRATIEKEFPCMAAVNRAAYAVPRHHARLIYLEYTGAGPIQETLCFVGKGVTHDTGGLDVKTDGAMFGMSRDKSGAAAVGGLFKTLEALQPKGIKVMGYMAMVRNSVGAESYACDEKLTARSGKRILVANTDAEGRLTMLDPLCHMKEMAQKEVNPHLFTIATLTGHAVLAIGDFCLALDNGPAWHITESSKKLAEASETVGDPVEISRLRKDDFAHQSAQSEYEDIRQGGTAPSSKTIRGHQGPAAFMVMGSGLDVHGLNSKHPIPFTHIDMAGREGPFPGIPYGAPVAALAARYILPRL